MRLCYQCGVDLVALVNKDGSMKSETSKRERKAKH